MNNLQLYSHHLQIMREKASASVNYVANANKYDAFCRRNGLRVNQLLNKISDLQEEYFVTENKEVKMKKRFFWSKPKPVMQKGKTEIEFNKEFNKLMEEPCVINV